MKKPELLVLALALLATAAKVYCAWTTIGTADVAFFAQFGHVIADRGVAAVYREVPIYNHPPLLTEYLGLIWNWADGHGRVISRLIRLPGIAAELATFFLLLWLRRKTGRPAWWAVALFAASPVSFMISGYHGNFDPFIVLGVMLTAVACVRGRPAWAGLLLGLTCQVKIIPLLVAPVFFFYWLHRRKALPFTGAAVATTLAGWIVPLCVVPGPFVKQVLAQNSIWGWWGFTYLLRMTGMADFFRASPPYSAAQTTVILALKALVIGSVLVLAWRGRAEPADALFSTLALAFLFFLVFAPGFGVQYLLWIAPFLLLRSERWYAAVTAASSVGLFAFYNSISGGMPWNQGLLIQPSIGTWGPWLLLPWAVLTACLAASINALFSEPRETAGTLVATSAQNASPSPHQVRSSATTYSSSSSLSVSSSGGKS